ncbi:nuclear pore membrane glycoprotein 210 [Diachasma alloeum]|uniref:nuclear pore membrane glycoprotein 210 n=1 Tax=Diachasma alloeum TaxID=454923 RepID=UPI000738383F|nr:nuclear pore membrane glycoprotein 210 [Diachasma alloeum]
MAVFNIFPKNGVFTLCILIYSTFSTADASRLNVPRVLLPVFNNFPVNFTLEVTEGGCYQWSTSRLDVVHLIPMNENPDRTCSSAVLVQSITRELTRNTAIVLAEDVNTGQFLRCDVIVDAIYSLNLVTTTRELFIEEAPEAFEVRAYDEQGNEFTTLAGVEFEWSIGNGERYSVQGDIGNSILRFMTFQESPYETPSTIAMLDGTGRQGSIILLEGVKTGTARVEAKLPYAEYKHVSPVEVELIVVANLIILPTDVTMMAFDNLKYKIMQVHQGRLEEIKLPSNQYYLVAETPEIVQIDNEHGYAYALQEGRSKVLLHDKNVNEEYGIVLPTATVHVNAVEYITITVLPNRNRGLILGHTHEIIVELFDAKDHKFHIGEGVEVSVDIDQKFFKTVSVTRNGTHIIGVPIACGTTTVEGELHGVINKRGKRIALPTPLTAKAELVIHTPVVVSPQILAVPWEPQSKARFDIALKATGGDGTYVWSTRAPSVASVTQNGVVRILSQGSTEVIVSMARNSYNKDRARVYVMSPSRLEIIEYSMDAATGEPIHLFIALYGKIQEDGKEIPFTDCRDTSFEVHIADSSFTRNSSDFTQPIGIACTTLTVLATSVGSSSVTVAYNSNGHYLTDNVTVSAYAPLVPIHPPSGETLLAVGSSRKIVFKGGPQVPAGKPQGLARDTSISDEEVVRITEIPNTSGQPDVSIFEVVCRSLGDVIFTFKVTNEPLLPNCRTTGASSTVRIICGKPRHIYLQPEFKDSDKCPITKHPERVMAHNDKPLHLNVIVKSEDGRRFDNFTSLNVEWTLTPSGVGTVEIASGILEETFLDFNVVLPSNHYQTVIPKRHTGTLTITATVTDYQKYILAKLRIAPEWPPFPVTTEKGTLATPKISAEISVVLVNNTIISPSRLKILNDPNVKYTLQVSQGSGYYEFILSSEEIADVRYVEPTRTINIIPKKSGSLQIALVDLCLISPPAVAEVDVQQLAGIEVESVNKVERGRCITATVRLFDTNGNVIELPSLESFDISADVDNSLIEIKKLAQSDQGEPPYTRILYMIHGVEEGFSNIVFSSGHSDQEIRSESSSIQVFLPLRITQRNITVLIGTIYQVMTTGGPSNARIEFIVDHEDILTIHDDGIFEGKEIGSTRVSARAVGFDSGGNRVVYSEDHVDIRVVQLEGVKIVVPTSKIKVGATIPLWAFGVPDNLTPLIIGSMKSQLIFTWSTGDPSLLNLHNMYEGTGINIRYQNEVTLRAKALKPGVSTVYLNVTVPPKTLAGYKDVLTFGTFIKIEIIEELSLINPEFTTGAPVILMTPHSSLKLRTNRDQNGVTTYKILVSGQSGEPEDSNALITSKTVTVDKTGVIKSGESLGRTVISITSVEAYNLKQSLTIMVDVKPIHYMMFSLSSKVQIRSGEELNILPKGMELNYVVEYFDAIGNKFHAAETRLRTMSNRGDLLSFTPTGKNEVSVKFHETGELVAKIYNEKYPNAMFDYVHMMIGDIIFPSKTVLTVGDVVCFSMPLLSPETGDPGFWRSSNPDVLTVDSITGIGRAKNPGQTIVKHSLTTDKQGEIEVNVQPISKISLVFLRGKNVTGSEVFSVPLVLKSKDEGIKENNVLARGLGGCRTRSDFVLEQFPFTCSIQFTSKSPVNVKDVFIARPRFDIVSGFYYCDVVPISGPTLMSSTLETKIQVNAQTREVEGKSLEIPYLPAVFVDSSDVVFVQGGGQTATSVVEVHGLPGALEYVNIEMPEGVVVNSREIAGNKLIFRLRLMQNVEDVQGQRLRIFNEITRQNISVVVRTSRYEDYVAISGIHWLDYLYYHRYTFITFLVLILTIVYVWKRRVSSVDVSVLNTSVFADKYPPPLRQSPNHTLNSSFNESVGASPKRSPESPLRPFSAFVPVYGDPRGFYTPNGRRRVSLNPTI